MLKLGELSADSPNPVETLIIKHLQITTALVKSGEAEEAPLLKLFK